MHSIDCPAGALRACGGGFPNAVVDVALRKVLRNRPERRDHHAFASRAALLSWRALRGRAAAAGCRLRWMQWMWGGGCARVLEDPTTRPRRVATAAATPPSGCSTPRPTCHRGRSRGCSGCAVMSGECAAVAPWRGQLAAGVGEIDGAFPNSPRSPMHRLAAPPRGKRDVDNL